MNTLKKYAMGLGEINAIQQAVDYGTAGLVGAGAQQLNNWLLPGSDPNPLVSGALFAPLGTAILRKGRSFSPEALGRNFELNVAAFQNPYTAAAYNASLAAAATGAGTSLYNSVAGGSDVDNNLVAGGAALLAGTFPLAAKLIKGNPSINRGGLFGEPSGNVRDHHTVPRNYGKERNPNNEWRK